MGFLDRFSGAREVARVTISFQEDGNHRITIEREPTDPTYLNGPVLNAALFLNYAARGNKTASGVE